MFEEGILRCRGFRRPVQSGGDGCDRGMPSHHPHLDCGSDLAPGRAAERSPVGSRFLTTNGSNIIGSPHFWVSYATTDDTISVEIHSEVVWISQPPGRRNATVSAAAPRDYGGGVQLLENVDSHPVCEFGPVERKQEHQGLFDIQP